MSAQTRRTVEELVEEVRDQAKEMLQILERLDGAIEKHVDDEKEESYRDGEEAGSSE